MKFGLLFSCCCALLCLGGEKTSLTVRAVTHETRVNERTGSYVTPGRSSTTCSGSQIPWALLLTERPTATPHRHPRKRIRSQDVPSTLRILWREAMGCATPSFAVRVVRDDSNLLGRAKQLIVRGELQTDPQMVLGIVRPHQD
jgi:hypothetical protein